MSTTKILISAPYNHYIEVSAELLGVLINAPVYYQSYDSVYKYSLKEEPLEIHVISSKDIKEESPEVIDIDNIMEENNRLTRENELLKEKLEGKPVLFSKEVGLYD